MPSSLRWRYFYSYFIAQLLSYLLLSNFNWKDFDFALAFKMAVELLVFSLYLIFLFNALQGNKYSKKDLFSRIVEMDKIVDGTTRV